MDFESFGDAVSAHLASAEDKVLLKTQSAECLSRGELSSLVEDSRSHMDTTIPMLELELAHQPKAEQDDWIPKPSRPESPAISVSDSSSTLFSIAIQMVSRYNKKRLSEAELNQRLRCGFRQALEPSQGCRVENYVLFNVLAEISV